MNKKVIGGLLWGAVAVRALHFLLAVVLTVGQELYKGSILHTSSGYFIFPADVIIGGLFSVVIMFVFALLISMGLKKDSKGIGLEITAVILYGIVFKITSQSIAFIFNIAMARQGGLKYAEYTAVNQGMTIIEGLAFLAAVMVIFACGLSIAYKKCTKLQG